MTPFSIDIKIRKSLRSNRGSFDLDVCFTSTTKRIAIIGPSGAGKSLTLKVVAGLLRPDVGHIRIDADTFFDSSAGISLPPHKRGVGYLFQEYALFPHLNVRQNIAFCLNKGLINPTPSYQSNDVDHWMRVFNLGPVQKLYPYELSGGQKQRTALARTLIAKPKTLLLDEPFTALNADLRKSLRQELVQVQKELGVPMLLITHDMEDADQLSDECLTIQDGRIVR